MWPGVGHLRRMQMETLPTEILREIFKYLSFVDYLSCRQVCKAFFEAAAVREPWMRLDLTVSAACHTPDGPASGYESDGRCFPVTFGLC